MIHTVIDLYLQRHEAFLNQAITRTLSPAPLIQAAMQHALFPGGKRIRPLLVYLAGSLCNLSLDVCDILAAAIELTHCYSLIHDDLPAMDNDDFRRGRPSCHKQFDEASAILAGDGMQALAIELLLHDLTPHLPAPKIIAVTQELLKASGIQGMISGQSLDLSELTNPSLSEERIQYIHELKTGRLITACFTMVLAASAKLDTPTAQQLITYAHHLGLVFQIQDDYLDLYAPKEHLGKQRSSDQENAKTTYATLFSQQQLKEKITTHYQQALSCLHSFGANAQALESLTIQLQQRSQL